ncbi:MAG: CDP-glycerol glycerophosphotransferase family protein [Candidatus Andersenbacteria bacterium]
MPRPLTLLFSVPTGYNARELLTPLQEHLERDEAVGSVICLTPAAAAHQEIFPSFTKKFRFIANPARQTLHHKLLQQLAPDIVVTPTAGLDHHDTPILRASQQLNIPSLTFISSWDNVYKMERFQKYGKAYELADHLVVWNQMMHDHLRKIFPHLKSEAISIIGAPRLDFFTHTDRLPSKKTLLQHLGLPYDRGKIIHLATTELYPMGYIVQTIREAETSGKIPHQLHIYASVHPGGDLSKHRAYARQYGVVLGYSFGRRESSSHPNFLYNPTREEIYLLVALFKHADVLVNHSSTVAIESLFANVPVINVKYGQPLDWWRWYRSMVYRDFQQHYADITAGQATTIVHSKRELIQALNKDLADPGHLAAARQQTLKRIITTIDGTAGRQLLDKIKQIAVQRKT